MDIKKTSILLIDDDKFLLDMYARKFTNNGLLVDAACGPDIGLKKLRDGARPDIVLLDVVMPNMDGLELLQIIQKENLAPGATFIMLTNQSQQADIEKAKNMNVDGYIIKATTIPSEVLSKVMNIYNKKK